MISILSSILKMKPSPFINTQIQSQRHRRPPSPKKPPSKQPSHTLILINLLPNV